MCYTIQTGDNIENFLYWHDRRSNPRPQRWRNYERRCQAIRSRFCSASGKIAEVRVDCYYVTGRKRVWVFLVRRVWVNPNPILLLDRSHDRHFVQETLLRIACFQQCFFWCNCVPTNIKHKCVLLINNMNTVTWINEFV